MHEEELDVTGVLDEESLVARGHHVLGLLVATVSDLLLLLVRSSQGSLQILQQRKHTEGMGMLLLNRLRTRLSIPLGLRHDEGTHLKRSDWWRQKVLVPVFVSFFLLFFFAVFLSVFVFVLSLIHVHHRLPHMSCRHQISTLSQHI